MEAIKQSIVEIINDLHPEIDAVDCDFLVDGGIIDSFDIVSIISEIAERWDVSVPADEIVPENFNSADALAKLVGRLLDGE